MMRLRPEGVMLNKDHGNHPNETSRLATEFVRQTTTHIIGWEQGLLGMSTSTDIVMRNSFARVKQNLLSPSVGHIRAIQLYLLITQPHKSPAP
nr:hypothetical protein [Tanacetum cinerariifolium]